MAMEDMLKGVVEAIEKEGNARAVFGEPLKLENHIVIPVAMVAIGGGAGGVVAGQTEIKMPIGSGGGLGINVRPVGFIHERQGEVIFTPIRLDGRGSVVDAEAGRGLDRLFEALATAVTGRGTKNAPTAD